jgi:hypothetical protein
MSLFKILEISPDDTTDIMYQHFVSLSSSSTDTCNLGEVNRAYRILSDPETYQIYRNEYKSSSNHDDLLLRLCDIVDRKEFEHMRCQFASSDRSLYVAQTNQVYRFFFG